MKEKLKNIPMIGFLLRWLNNLMRLNNLKHTLFMQQQQLSEMQHHLVTQQFAINFLQEQNQRHVKNYQHIQDTIKYQLDRGISSASVTLYQKILAQLDTIPKQNPILKQTIKDAILDDYYLSFEDRFRGEQEVIAKRYEEYLPYLKPDIKKALDIGCGRGEWVNLLQQNAIDAYGIDLNASMLNAAQKRGIKNLTKVDAFEFFNQCEENSFDLVTAFHVIEHIPFEELFAFLEQISRIATSDATIMLETPNPANLQVAAYTFYRDPTHLNPLPSEVISFMLEYLGFRDIKVHFLHPYAQEQHLQENSECAKALNQFLYSNQDYLIVATNKKREEQKRVKKILVDVSSICLNDLKTGIQRVVRSQLKNLIKLSPLDYAIEPVYLKELDNKYVYAYATYYTSNLLDIELQMSDSLVEIENGDIFYGLDFSPHEVSLANQTSLYQEYKALGVKVFFMVYDILPIVKPDYFPSHTQQAHKKWLEEITSIADGLICISQTVADEVSEWTNKHQKAPSKTLIITSIHLGADIDGSTKDLKQPSKEEFELLERIKAQTTFLMVGTVEPRKGHLQTLKAFDLLWAKGTVCNLVIIGKSGWMVDESIEYIKNHPMLNTHLFWLNACTDELLEAMYQTAQSLIAASYEEGFGLPLIEAARHGIPIIVRDIPVFKEVAGDFAFYFPNDSSAHTLASSIQSWLELYEKKEHPLSRGMPYITWEENAKKLLALFDARSMD